jgi:hypothetical protein
VDERSFTARVTLSPLTPLRRRGSRGGLPSHSRASPLQVLSSSHQRRRAALSRVTAHSACRHRGRRFHQPPLSRVGSVTLGLGACVRGRGAAGSQVRHELHARSCWRDHDSDARIVSQLARSESREVAPPAFRRVESEVLPALFFPVEEQQQ